MAKASAVRPYLLDLHFINKNLRFVKISFLKRGFKHFLCSCQGTMIKKFGGDEENRTPDPLLARQVLSQLSYTPTDVLISPSSQKVLSIQA